MARLHLSRFHSFSPSISAAFFRAFTMPATSSPASSVIIPNPVVEDYENAVRTLNKLQSNSQTIAKIRQNLEMRRATNHSLVQTMGALETVGMQLDELDKLNIIHVAGTKGKGMTCAFTEAILRHAGIKTGFFSSPHMTAVRERIRINGKPLSTTAFAKHFFAVYNRLKPLNEPNAPYDMPNYFRFLTLMAFHVFLEEHVDVVVLEVGIGGTNDCTNIIRKPVVVGISSLGLEHQVILGKTLEEIAIQKAGIMKTGVPVYTVETHPPHIHKLLHSYAATVKCSLHCVPNMDFSNLPGGLGVDDGSVSRTNASLAVHLANEFILKKHSKLFPDIPSEVTSALELKYSTPKNFLPFHVHGLESTKWDGRFQTIVASNHLKYFLDGAHTIDSTQIALKWFERVSSGSSLKILVFNLTGERSSRQLLEPFAQSGFFDVAIFCPFLVSKNWSTPDNWSALDAETDIMEGCRRLLKVWETLQSTTTNVICDSAESTVEYIEELVKKHQLNANGVAVEKTTPTSSVLITGSLHLVGTFLSVLDPNRNDDESDIE
ncbi:Folylpolyglutamate synthase, mitochondrial [Orchesella cincta]|uniref:Folylpolyglutamate synthase n=1 Tax=Orchesella cincta TaxID=48709 RepID=A0A1D2NMH8_ORCCI|nr:Folylpolyglutamate synthase, mitochondrial [Orchesella cincta]